jgi:hypothetical protein
VATCLSDTGRGVIPAVNEPNRKQVIPDENRWDEKAGLRRDAVGSQVIDALEAQEIKETGNEED